MSILLSANPPHAGNICDGIKPVEWRKKPLPKGRAFIYETKKGGGCAMVIGECEIVGAIAFDPKRIPDDILKGGCVDRDFILRYAGAGAVVANFCINAKRYDNPIPLTEFVKANGCKNCPLRLYREDASCKEFTGCEYEGERITRPPQSWCYVDEK